MMLRSLAFVSLLMSGLAVPAAAEPLTEQQSTKVAQAIVDAFNKANAAKDGAAIGALYTEDAIRVLGTGALAIGSKAIGEAYAKGFADFDLDPIALDKVKVLDDTVVVMTGTWTGAWRSDKGPVPMHGRWLSVDMRMGDTWKGVAGSSTIARGE